MVDLRIILGTVNFNDWIRVSAEKVGAPGIEVWVDYFDVPASNFTFIIPNLDPDNYYINFRDAPNTGVLGTLVSQAFVNALTGEWQYERRFYTIGSLPGGVTCTIDTLTDPYFSGRNLTGVFKEAFRYLELTNEWTYDDPTTTISILGGLQTLSNGEKFIVEIKYNVGTTGSTVATGLFTETITVTTASYVVSALDKFKRHCLDSAGSKQQVQLPPLSSIATGDWYYFEHKRDGVQVQSRLIVDGTDKVLFNGFSLPGGNLLTELWINKGHGIYVRKELTRWEIILDYDGVNVGKRGSGFHVNQAGYLPEDGALKDGDDLPGLYWFIRNVLPAGTYIIDDTVASGGYTHPADRRGQFVIHSTGKAFRMPNSQGLSEKSLSDFDTYGGDATRSYDYPGGYQAQRIMKHRHLMRYKNGKSDQTESGTQDRFFRELVAGGDNYGTIDQFDIGTVFDPTLNTDIGGNFNIVDNLGYVKFVHI